RATAGNVAAETAPNPVAAEAAVGGLSAVAAHDCHRGHKNSAGAGFQLNHAAQGAVFGCARVAAGAAGTAASEAVSAVAPGARVAPRTAVEAERAPKADSAGARFSAQAAAAG